MQSDDAYLVLNMAFSHLWDAMHDGERIPSECRPTVVHRDRATAEAEALRLQKEHPEGPFVVFTATHVTAAINAPTHSTLGGQTFGAQTFAVLCEVGDGIPF